MKSYKTKYNKDKKTREFFEVKTPLDNGFNDSKNLCYWCIFILCCCCYCSLGVAIGKQIPG